MNTVFEFMAKRKRFTNEFFPTPGSTKTVLISSYIWWTELIAYALIRLGYNVLVAEPWYMMWIDDRRFVNFDTIYNQWVQTIKKFNVQLILGGNTTCIVPHPRTKQLLHNEAGVPLVNYWWDEPRAMPPLTKRGFSAHDYLSAVRDSRTLNVMWDADVEEELRRFLAIENTAHVPLGTTPEFWQTNNLPLNERPTPLCFLGNNHDEGNWIEKADPKVVDWAERVAAVKLANLDRSMADCIEQVGGPGEVRGSTARRPYELAPSLKEEFERWNILGGILVLRGRNTIVKAAAERLGEQFVIVGKGWERMGLRAAKEHSGVPGAKDFYASARASLNLFGGCVHGGMPLRPYEIACSNGLLFTQYNRELPSLFEPGRECLAFRNASEMLHQLDQLQQEPSRFDAIVAAGRQRTATDHTWQKRLERIMQLAKERFDLPW